MQMHPMAMHDLAKIRQAEYVREAQEHRLAKASKGETEKVDDRVRVFDLRAAIAGIFKPRHTARTNPI
jgi:hypothetical protein